MRTDANPPNSFQRKSTASEDGVIFPLATILVMSAATTRFAWPTMVSCLLACTARTYLPTWPDALLCLARPACLDKICRSTSNQRLPRPPMMMIDRPWRRWEPSLGPECSFYVAIDFLEIFLCWYPQRRVSITTLLTHPHNPRHNGHNFISSNKWGM